MKKSTYFLAFIISFSVLFSSCVTVNKPIYGFKPINPSNVNQSVSDGVSLLNRDDLIITKNVIAKKTSITFWALFIPLGNPMRTSTMTAQAYQKALKIANKESDTRIDGILTPQYTFSRIKVPLVVVTFNYKTVTCEGKAYRVKLDEETEKNE
jgi:hypothetical protein